MNGRLERINLSVVLPVTVILQIVLVRYHETDDIDSSKELETEAIVRGLGLWLCQEGAPKHIGR